MRSASGRECERGHLLVGLMVLLACMLIMLTAAAQSWTFLVRRDREAELIQRGEEYAKAIAFYQKEVGAYPLKLDLLVQKGPHGHRFIRQLYKDPLADDGEWGLLFLSPTGQGFINPYATQLGEGFIGGDLSQDPSPGQGGIGGLVAGRGGIGAGGGGIGGGFGNAGGFGNKKGSGKTGFGRSNKNDTQAPGYSELDPASLKAFEGAVMPIVGVVHKKEEWGVKNYKGQATLNDWAFTLIDEGGQHQAGGKRQAPMPKTGPRFGIGDAHQPIFLPGSGPAPPPRGKPLKDQMRENVDRYQEERDRQQRYLEGDFEEDEETGDEEGVEEGDKGEGGSDADPNGGGEDADPNGGEDADPNGGDDDEGEDEDPNGNGGT